MDVPVERKKVHVPDAAPPPNEQLGVVVPIETGISIKKKIAIFCSIFSCLYMSSRTKAAELLITAASIVKKRGFPKFNQTLTKDECSEYLVSLSEAIVKIKQELEKSGHDSQSLPYELPYEHVSVVTVDGEIQVKLNDATIDIIIPDKPAKLVAWLALEQYGRCSSTTLMSWGDTTKVSLDELITIIVEDKEHGYKESSVRVVLGMIQMSQTGIAEIIEPIKPFEGIFLDLDPLEKLREKSFDIHDLYRQTDKLFRLHLGNNVDEFTGKVVRIGATQAVYTLVWLFTEPYGMVLLLIGLFSFPVLFRMIQQSFSRWLHRAVHPQVPGIQGDHGIHGVPEIQRGHVIQGRNEIHQLIGGVKRKFIITNKMEDVLYLIIQNPNKIRRLVVTILKQYYPTHPFTLQIEKIQGYRERFRSIASSAWNRLRGTEKKEKKGGKRKSSTKKRKTNKKYHK
jgi:hypothetical protein